MNRFTRHLAALLFVPMLAWAPDARAEEDAGAAPPDADTPDAAAADAEVTDSAEAEADAPDADEPDAAEAQADAPEAALDEAAADADAPDADTPRAPLPGSLAVLVRLRWFVPLERPLTLTLEGPETRSFEGRTGEILELLDLPPGRWSLRASVEGFTGPPQVVQVPQVQGTDMVLVPSGVVRLAGRVTDVDGAPVVGAQVEAVLLDATGVPVRWTTDAAGSWEPAQLAAGTWRIRVDAPAGHWQADRWNLLADGVLHVQLLPPDWGPEGEESGCRSRERQPRRAPGLPITTAAAGLLWMRRRRSGL
jgi:hypothetical protein